MPSRMSRNFPSDGMKPAPGGMGPIPRSVPDPDIRNREGFPAWSATEQERVAEVLFLGTFGNTFYARGGDLANEAVDVLRKAIVNDPVFVAQAAVLAREEGYIRSAPIVALALLTAGDQTAKDIASRIYLRILRNGDDLRNFVAFVQSGAAGRKFGGLAQRLARDWLKFRLDEYQAMKYAGSTDRLSLRNIIRLTHPKSRDQWRNALYRWVVKGEVDAALNPRARALTLIGKGEVFDDSLVRRYNLPYEAVVPRLQKKDRATMQALAAQAPYFNLLRGLSEFGRAGVWDTYEAVDRAVSTLTNPDIIAKTRVLPFRYLTAVKALEADLNRSVPRRLVDALYQALELSLANVPELPGRVVIAPDVSGSMVTASVGKFTTAAEIAGLFTAALWKRNPYQLVMPFNTSSSPLTGVSSHDSAMTIARRIGSLGGGGTNLAAPLQWLMQRGQPIDLYIGLTDNEDWAGRGWLSMWEEYKRRVTPNARAVLVTLVPYGDRPTPPEYPGVEYVYGWSDSVLKYIGEAAWPGGRGLVARVEQVNLSYYPGGARESTPGDVAVDSDADA